MAAIALHEPKPELVSRWHRQIGRERSMRLCRGPRPFAAMFFSYRGFASDGLVDLSRLRIDVLHDLQITGAPVAHRMARYTAGLNAEGIILGGASRIQFDKNLAQMPGRKSLSRRIGAKDSKLLGTALEMDRFLERRSRHPHYPRRSTPCLPRFWVSLDHDHPHGAGPAFEQFVRNTGWEPELALTSVRHLCRGRWTYPLEYVAHLAKQIHAAFVDLTAFSRRQIIRIQRPTDLIDTVGACSFDFWSSDYRSGEF